MLSEYQWQHRFNPFTTKHTSHVRWFIWIYKRRENTHKCGVWVCYMKKRPWLWLWDTSLTSQWCLLVNISPARGVSSTVWGNGGADEYLMSAFNAIIVCDFSKVGANRKYNLFPLFLSVWGEEGVWGRVPRALHVAVDLTSCLHLTLWMLIIVCSHRGAEFSYQQQLQTAMSRSCEVVLKPWEGFCVVFFFNRWVFFFKPSWIVSKGDNKLNKGTSDYQPTDVKRFDPPMISLCRFWAF